MRYFHAPQLDYHESRALSRVFGKHYTPDAEVTLASTTTVASPGVDLVGLDGEILAIEPDTASWAFVTPREASLLADLDYGRSVGWIRAQAGDAADPLIGALYRRGLVTLDGRASVDPTLFQDSHNTREKNLVELLLTEKCNLNCGYCLAGANPNMPTMTWDIARATVDLAFRMNEADSISFQFAGGEPFLQYELMKQTVAYIQRHPDRVGREVYFSVQTNGTLLTDERILWCRDNAVQIGFSIDGPAWAQDQARPFVNGKGSFERVLKGLELLQKHEIAFGAIVVLSRANVADPQALVDFMIDNGVHGMKLNPIAYIGTGRDNWNALGLHPHEISQYMQAVARIIAEQRHPLTEANIGSMLTHLVSKQRPTRCLRGHCGAGRAFQAINAKGDIHPCGRGTQTPDMKLGNVLHETRSLSMPSREHPLIQQIEVRRPKTVEGCDTCSYRELCQAGCSMEAYERYGTVRHKTPDCDYFMEIYPALMRWLTFAPGELQHLSDCGYFYECGSGPIELVAHDYLPGAGDAPLATRLSEAPRISPRSKVGGARALRVI